MKYKMPTKSRIVLALPLMLVIALAQGFASSRQEKVEARNAEQAIDNILPAENRSFELGPLTGESLVEALDGEKESVFSLDRQRRLFRAPSVRDANPELLGHQEFLVAGDYYDRDCRRHGICD